MVNEIVVLSRISEKLFFVPTIVCLWSFFLSPVMTLFTIRSLSQEFSTEISIEDFGEGNIEVFFTRPIDLKSRKGFRHTLLSETLLHILYRLRDPKENKLGIVESTVCFDPENPSNVRGLLSRSFYTGSF